MPVGVRLTGQRAAFADAPKMPCWFASQSRNIGGQRLMWFNGRGLPRSGSSHSVSRLASGAALARR